MCIHWRLMNLHHIVMLWWRPSTRLHLMHVAIIIWRTIHSRRRWWRRWRRWRWSSSSIIHWKSIIRHWRMRTSSSWTVVTKIIRSSITRTWTSSHVTPSHHVVITTSHMRRWRSSTHHHHGTSSSWTMMISSSTRHHHATSPSFMMRRMVRGPMRHSSPASTTSRWTTHHSSSTRRATHHHTTSSASTHLTSRPRVLSSHDMYRKMMCPAA